MKRIAILVLESCWSASVMLPAEIFNTAVIFAQRYGRANLEVTLLGMDTQPVNSFSGIYIQPQESIAADYQYDAILLPTIWNLDTEYLAKHQSLYPWLKAQHHQGALLFGALTGSYLMAEAGLLDGLSATTHWKYASDFRKRYPKVNLQAERMQTFEHRLYCGGGVMASMDLSLNLIQRFCGNAIAQQCERHCLMGSRRDYKRLNIDTQPAKRHNDMRILHIQDWLEAHYAEPLSLEEVSERFGFSQRNLSRRFKKATGKPLYAYLRDYRIEVAKQLLQHSTSSVQEVCFNVGYESLTVFGRQFKAVVGESATVFREINNKKQ